MATPIGPHYERETAPVTLEKVTWGWRRISVIWGGAFAAALVGTLLILAGIHTYQDHQTLHAIQGWVENVIRAQQQQQGGQKPPEKQP